MSRDIWRRAFCIIVLLGAGPVLAASTPAAGVTLDGAVQHPQNLAPSDLMALPAQTVAVTFQTEHGTRHATFTGVPLWTLLGRAALAPIPHVKNARLREIVLATGRDGYQAAFSVGELDPDFAGAAAPVLVAYAQDGKPLGADALRVVVPGDRAGGRYVAHLARLTVIDTATEEQPK